MKNHVSKPKTVKELKSCLEHAKNIKGNFILNLVEFREVSNRENFPITDILDLHLLMQDRFYIVVEKRSEWEEEFRREALVGILNLFNAEEHLATLIHDGRPFYLGENLDDNRCKIALHGTLKGKETATMFFDLVEDVADILFIDLDNCYSWDEHYADEFRALRGKKRIYLINKNNGDAPFVFHLPNAVFYSSYKKAAAVEDLTEEKKCALAMENETIVLRGFFSQKLDWKKFADKLQKKLKKVDPYGKKNLVVDIKELHEMSEKGADILFKVLYRLKGDRTKAYLVTDLPRSGNLSSVIYKLYAKNFLIISHVDDIPILDKAMAPNLQIDKARKHPTLVIKGNFFDTDYFKKAIRMLKAAPLSNLKNQSHYKKESNIFFYDIASLPCPSYEILNYIINQRNEVGNFLKIILGSNHVKELLLIVLHEKTKEGLQALSGQNLESSLQTLLENFVPKIPMLIRDFAYRKSIEPEISEILTSIENFPKDHLLYNKILQIQNALEPVLVYPDRETALKKHQRGILFIASAGQRQLIENIKLKVQELSTLVFGNINLFMEQIEDIHMIPEKFAEEEFSIIVYSQQKELAQKIPQIYENYRRKGNPVLGLVKRTSWVQLSPYQIERDCKPEFIASRILYLLSGENIDIDETRYLFNGSEQQKLKNVLTKEKQFPFNEEQQQILQEFLHINEDKYYEMIHTHNVKNAERDKIEILEWRDWSKFYSFSCASKAIELVQAIRRPQDVQNSLAMLCKYATYPRYSALVEQIENQLRAEIEARAVDARALEIEIEEKGHELEEFDEQVDTAALHQDLQTLKAEQELLLAPLHLSLLARERLLGITLKSPRHNIKYMFLAVNTGLDLFWGSDFKNAFVYLEQQFDKDFFLCRLSKNLLLVLDYILNALQAGREGRIFWIMTSIVFQEYNIYPQIRVQVDIENFFADNPIAKGLKVFCAKKNIPVSKLSCYDELQIQLALTKLQ